MATLPSDLECTPQISQYIIVAVDKLTFRWKKLFLCRFAMALPNERDNKICRHVAYNIFTHTATISGSGF